MRLYLKLILMTVLFAGASSQQLARMISSLSYECRVGWICRFGSDADIEALVKEAQCYLATRQGNQELIQAGQRYDELVARRRADAARRNITLTDEELAEFWKEAFGPLLTSPAAMLPCGHDAPSRGADVRADAAR